MPLKPLIVIWLAVDSAALLSVIALTYFPIALGILIPLTLILSLLLRAKLPSRRATDDH